MRRIVDSWWLNLKYFQSRRVCIVQYVRKNSNHLEHDSKLITVWNLTIWCDDPLYVRFLCVFQRNGKLVKRSCRNAGFLGGAPWFVLCLAKNGVGLAKECGGVSMELSIAMFKLWFVGARSADFIAVLSVRYFPNLLSFCFIFVVILLGFVHSGFIVRIFVV